MSAQQQQQKQQPSILMVGLPLGGPAPPGADPDVGAKVKAGIAAVRELMQSESVALDAMHIGPQDDKRAFTDKLTQTRYGALIIGGGVKMMPMCNGLLEFMVNETKDKSPSTRIYFVPAPESILETAQRALKGVKM